MYEKITQALTKMALEIFELKQKSSDEKLQEFFDQAIKKLPDANTTEY